MVLTRIPWANRVWALPFLTALARSERYYANKPPTHKKLTVWVRQLLLQVKRWVGERAVIVVGDSSYAVIELLGSLQGQVSLISGLRLDASLYEPAPVRAVGQGGRKKLKVSWLPTLLAMAADKRAQWESLAVDEWYGGLPQTLD